jgi:hypothetical protein
VLQVVGNVAQTMSTYMSAYSLLGGLFGDKVGSSTMPLSNQVDNNRVTLCVSSYAQSRTVLL